MGEWPTLRDLTPVIIGVGEASERIEAPNYVAHSPVDLAAQAARAALDMALGTATLAAHIDVIAAIRQFEVSGPRAVAPFGRADNFPRAVGKRIGADPVRAILEPVGGQGPQHLVNEFAQAIALGKIGMALICGSEAISTVRHLTARGETRDWSESVGGQLEDRGFGERMLTRDLTDHGVRSAITAYALCENARCARLGLGRADYRLEMGRLFAPFTRVAAGNPHAMSRQVHTAEDLATVTELNRLTSDPFPRRLVARDQANQGAAVLITSVAKARELGVPEDRYVYLHGGADIAERTLIERRDLSSSPASVMAVERALAAAGVSIRDVAVFDFYSCFPIAVFNVRDGLGIAADDPRPLTVTGGLPYFGGAGNNYSMHAIAGVVRALRDAPGAFGLVCANGGILSKYSVGIYSTKPTAWRAFDNKALQGEVDAWPAPALAGTEAADGIIETYTIDYAAAAPRGIVIGRRARDGARFVAKTDEGDAIVKAMIDEDPLGARVSYAPNPEGLAVLKMFEPVRVRETA